MEEKKMKDGVKKAGQDIKDVGGDIKDDIEGAGSKIKTKLKK